MTKLILSEKFWVIESKNYYGKMIKSIVSAKRPGKFLNEILFGGTYNECSSFMNKN